LMGLLFTMHLQKREATLHIYAPQGLDEIIITHLRHGRSVLNYSIDFHHFEGNKSEQILDDEYLTVQTIPMNHGVPCCGFLFKEKAKSLNINKEKLPPNLPIPLILALKNGEDIVFEGEKIENQLLTLPPAPLRSYAFCADSKYYESIIAQIQGASMIYHEATLTEEYADRIQNGGMYHSTAKQAGTIALKAGVKKLIIGHFSVRYTNLNVFLREASAVFKNTVLAVEGETYQID